MFAVEVINYYQNIDKIHENLSTRKKVVELLNQFKEKFEKIRVFERLMYVEPKTKEQFVTFVLFYYYCWMDGLMLLLTGEPSPFAHKYPEINPASMEEELLEKARLHINSEREKYYSFFMNCIKKQKNRLSLLDPKLYLPTGYKKMVLAVANNNIQDFDFSNYEER